VYIFAQQSRPMTRYLPIRDDALDLRHFVELSGHLLDQRSHVTVTATACRGFLTKMGGRFRTWHKRWFVFEREKKGLAYYADRAETRLRRTIAFRAMEDVFVDHLRMVKSPNPAWTFCLKTVERSYFLVAPSAEAMRIWIDVLFTGAEGYREFT
jgi:pleckstrin homology-like domain family B